MGWDGKAVAADLSIRSEICYVEARHWLAAAARAGGGGRPRRIRCGCGWGAHVCSLTPIANYVCVSSASRRQFRCQCFRNFAGIS